MFHDDRFDQDIYAYRTPGYPLFLAACGASPVAARAAQAFLDISIALAAYLLARQVRGSRSGVSEEVQSNLDLKTTDPCPLLAAAFIAFNPFLVYFSGLILSETLFAAMLMWGVVFLAWYPAGERDGGDTAKAPDGLFNTAQLSGLALLALSILVRPASLFLPILIAAITPAARLRQRISRIAIAILLIFLILLPWAIRNRLLLGRWVWLTTNGGITQYDGFNPAATGASDQSFLQRPDLQHVRSMSEVDRDRYFSNLASGQIRMWLRSDPARLFSLAAAKLARTWSPVPLSAEFGSRKIYLFVAAIFAIPFDLLIILGLIAGRLPWRMKVLLLAPALYFTAVHALSVGSLRYRIPSEPPLAIIAAAGVGLLKPRMDKKPGMNIRGSGTREGKQA